MRLLALKTSTVVGLILFAAACGGNGEPGVKLLYIEPVVQDPVPPDPFGDKQSSGMSRIQRAIARGPLEDNMIVLEEGETLALISEWSGISQQALIEDNPWVQDKGFKVGEAFNVRLSKIEFLDFQQLREGNKFKRIVMRGRNVEIERVIEYTVQKGDTSVSIASAFNAPLELLEAMNPLAKNLSLQPGQVLKVPIMKVAESAVPDDLAGKGGKERIPGPAAPNKPLIPMPPQDGGKTLLTGPGAGSR